MLSTKIEYSTTPQNDNDLMNKVVKGAKTAGDWVKNKFKKSLSQLILKLKVK